MTSLDTATVVATCSPSATRRRDAGKVDDVAAIASPTPKLPAATGTYSSVATPLITDAQPTEPPLTVKHTEPVASLGVTCAVKPTGDEHDTGLTVV